MIRSNPNAVSGFNGSNFNAAAVIEKFKANELERLKPVKARQAGKMQELEAWEAVKAEVKKIQDVAKSLTARNIWDAKDAESSDETTILATANTRAKAGKQTIAVDAIALAHQITSQGFASEDDVVGTGNIRLQVGEGEESTAVTIPINKSSNTLKGLRDAIKDSDAEVDAFIIKTGSSEVPFQLLLTSQKTGLEGQIAIEVNLKGGAVPPPNYTNSFDTLAEWEGVELEAIEQVQRAKGASTPIMEVGGVFSGKEDTTYTFTATRGGIISTESGVELSWADQHGNTGKLNLNSLNFIPGEFKPFDNGLSLTFSDGEIVQGDSFTINATSQKSELVWWLSDEERAPSVTQPSEWNTKVTEGGVKISGKYTGEDEQSIVFRIEGSGQVGGQKPLTLHWEFTDTGETGKFNIGHPYLAGDEDAEAAGAGAGGGLAGLTAFDFKDGEGLFTFKGDTAVEDSKKKISIGNGLFVEIPPVVLNDGDSADIDVSPEVSADLWWLGKTVTSGNANYDELIKWKPYEPERSFFSDESDEVLPKKRAKVSDGIIQAAGTKFSEPEISISGTYTAEEEKTFVFTVVQKGNVGITRGTELKWEDNSGGSGTVNVGDKYVPGSGVEFSDGLQLVLGKGLLLEGDSFSMSARTSTVQQAQDLILRLGASAGGGGVQISRSKNTANDVIDGINMEFLQTSDAPVTISVKGDQEKAKSLIEDFVEAYNSFSATAKAVTEFNASTNTAAPLLSDRNLANLTNEIASTVIKTVDGLPKSDNMLFSLGIRLNNKGDMQLDASKLAKKFDDNFGAVADLFRINGVSDNPALTFLGVTDNTKANRDGYKVDILQVPTKGTYTGTPLQSAIQINDTNNEFFILQNGRKSDAIQLRNDFFTPSSLAKAIQKRVNEDKVLGKRGIQVSAEGNKIKIISGSYGANSSIKIEAGREKNLSALGLSNGTFEIGKNVEGTINGEKTTGRGQLLTVDEGNPSEGLRVFVQMEESERKNGVDGTIKVTKGIASRMNKLLNKYTEPAQGEFKKLTSDINEEAQTYIDQAKRIQERIDQKIFRMQGKFAKLENTLGRLNSQKSYVGAQLATL